MSVETREKPKPKSWQERLWLEAMWLSRPGYYPKVKTEVKRDEA